MVCPKNFLKDFNVGIAEADLMGTAKRDFATWKILVSMQIASFTRRVAFEQEITATPNKLNL